MLKTNELKGILDNADYNEFIKYKELLSDDNRKSIRDLINKYENKFLKISKKIDEYNKRMVYEINLYDNGIKYIAGIDEVGRGPLAGPVYAAAVIMDREQPVLGIRDSKKLSACQREALSEAIKQRCIAFSIASASVEEIDSINILNASKLAMKRAVEGLAIVPGHLLIDAVKLENINIMQTSLIKGDDLSVSIGAASIIAKVERDRYMDELSKTYPQFLFEKNKGYGTMEHIAAIKEYGITDVHRKTFVKNFI